MNTNSSSHTYSVSLRIEGQHVSPADISSTLELASSYERVAGESRGSSGIFHKALWSYSAKNTLESETLEWDSLEDGLLKLMDELDSKRELIQSFARSFDVYWWCGHFQKSFDGGPEFSPVLLRKLADFGIPLYLDNYFSEAS